MAFFRQNPAQGKSFPVERTDPEWRAGLSAEAYRVLRQHGTERPGSSPLNAEKRPGRFLCAGCGQALFDAATKYESGTGWPSFYAPLEGAIGTQVDRALFMVRTEVHCANCGGHLGHVFPGLRYCLNGAALSFESIATP